MNSPVPDFANTNEALEYGSRADAAIVAAMRNKIDNLRAESAHSARSMDEKLARAFQIQFLNEAVRAALAIRGKPTTDPNAIRISSFFDPEAVTA